MGHYYTLLIVFFMALAIIDLVVGVSNDAVNFLNSAIGSKVFPVKTILIIASLGLGIGVLFSSGLMEVARVGIFNPSMFSFQEIMTVFFSVMVADILIINFFNSIGIPTSTTVSVLFCLLGAAFSMGYILIFYKNDTSQIADYVNISSISTIIVAILLSILLAFFIGAFIQFFSRLLFTFQFEKSSAVLKAMFSGLALACIGLFVILKGLSHTILLNNSIVAWIENYLIISFLVLFLLSTVFSYILSTYYKRNILKLVVMFGLFGLALSFAGNDLLNFIGVPIAALQSFELWHAANALSPVLPSDFNMAGLANTVQTPYYILMLAGFVMIGTLWISKRVFLVTETEINLARQNEGFERFKPHNTSRFIVKSGLYCNYLFNKMLSPKVMAQINTRFVKPELSATQFKAPSFDLIRASVNLMVASVLISVATSMKLPLSTTYVTFMVAMGTALADRAWSQDNAVYRVAGVLNIIASWFITSVLAFVISGIIVVIIYFGQLPAIIILLLLLSVNLIKGTLAYRNKLSKLKAKQKFNLDELQSIHEITTQYSDSISNILLKLHVLYSDVITNLSLLETKKLKKNKKSIKEIHADIDILKEMVFCQINAKEELSKASNKFYILTLEDLQTITNAISQMIKSSYIHVDNNHKSLTFNQIRGLKFVEIKTAEIFPKIINDTFKNLDFSKLKSLIIELETVKNHLNGLLDQQMQYINSPETGPKNRRLYFDMLKKSENMVVSLIIILKRYKEFNDTPIDR